MAASMGDILTSSRQLPSTFGPEAGLVLVGGVILLAVLVAVLAQYTESLKPNHFFLTPYFKFIYVSFFKPHTGKNGTGQQSALESFYAAQVGWICSSTYAYSLTDPP